MRSASLLSVLLALSLAGCRADYDIEEVATDEYLGITHEHDDTCDHDADEHVEDHHDADHEAVDEEAGLAVSSRHRHESGERNHGTEWMFNQPWAASFIWGKMLRDTVILLLLAGSILLISTRVGRRKR